ncbi:peroxiredoxin family protein [Poriferisphaera sp. WC338]|uniref:peroxiredoxin family protein n=1 Tax=Poriferisphaera sp. WC338 TaxID=3425129 RepID=UPI003D8146A7
MNPPSAHKNACSTSNPRLDNTTDKDDASKRHPFSLPLSIYNDRNMKHTAKLLLIALLLTCLGCAARTAPDFTAPSLTQPNTNLSLANDRGKYILLAFWSSASQVCRLQMPYIQKTWDAFKDRPNFTVIALSLDDDPNKTIAYSEKHNLTFPQGYLGKWEFDTVRPAYKTRGIPAIFLINPQGKIIATNLRQQDIYTTVKAHLNP